MEEKYTEEEIKKALEQADANIELEEAVPAKKEDKAKVFRKDLRNERDRRSN